MKYPWRWYLFRWIKRKAGLAEGMKMPWWLIAVHGVLFPWEFIRWRIGKTGPIKYDIFTGTIEVWGVKMTKDFVMNLPRDKNGVVPVLKVHVDFASWKGTYGRMGP